MRKKKQQEEQQARSSDDPRITPEDVQRVEFRLAFRGYRERDVDAFLDRITGDLSTYLEEIGQLRAGVAPVSAGPGAQADDVLEGARREAAEIVRQAEQQAAAIRAAAATASGGDARSAVAPFLNTEREFLQSLGSLVQSHAEEIKRMVMAIREREQPSATPPPEPQAVMAAEEPATTAQPEAIEPASAAEIRERLGATDEGPTITIPDEEPAPHEPQRAAVTGSATEPVYSAEAGPPAERRERSLRELFWGED